MYCTNQVKTTETIPTIDEITKFSALFEDSFTLDDLNVSQLQALCKILGIGFVGTIPSANVLRFRIIMTVRELELDDKVCGLFNDDRVEVEGSRDKFQIYNEYKK